MHVSGLTISGNVAAIISIVVLLVLIAAAWAYKTANRLDRLNVRVDLARGSLDAALARRAVVARVLASGLAESGDPATAAIAADLSAAADRAESAEPVAREQAENELSAALARVDVADRPPAMVAELADAQTRVMMARRFYNDAVRDTLALARRRPVRWLRLGGTAAPPEYFEISER